MISGVSTVGRSKPQKSAANQKMRTKGSLVDSGPILTNPPSQGGAVMPGNLPQQVMGPTEPDPSGRTDGQYVVTGMTQSIPPHYIQGWVYPGDVMYQSGNTGKIKTPVQTYLDTIKTIPTPVSNTPSKVKHTGKTKAEIVAIKNTIIFDNGIVSRKLKSGSKYWAKGLDNKYYEYTAAGRSGRGARTGVPTGVVSDTRPEGPVILPKPAPTPAPKPTHTPITPRPTPTPKQHNPRPTPTPKPTRTPKSTTPKLIPFPGPINGPIYILAPTPTPKQTPKSIGYDTVVANLDSASMAREGGPMSQITRSSTPTRIISGKVSSPVANALVGSKSDAVSAIGVKSKDGR